MRWSVLTIGFFLMGGLSAQAQDDAQRRFLCAPEFKIEPTITFTTLFNSPRIIANDGTPVRDRRETDFELILSFGLPTRSRGWTSQSKRSFCPSRPTVRWNWSLKPISCGFPHAAREVGSARTSMLSINSVPLSGQATAALIRTN